MQSFKRILKTVSIFLAVVIVLSIGFGALYFRGENYDYQDYRERDALAGKLTVLINGASYVMYGVDPEVLDHSLGVNSYNLTTSMLTLEGRYTLLAKELARNPVHTVILEVSPDTVIRNRAEEVPEGDLHMLGKLGTAAERWAYFKDNFYLSEYPLAYYDAVSRGMESAFALLTGRYQKENTVARKGFYYTDNEKRPIPTDYRNIYHVHSFPDVSEIPEENVKGLERLLDLCRENGATPILISIPNSKAYNCMYANLDDYDRWYQEFAASHDVKYVNFNRHKEKLTLLPDETCFYDETHLNQEGAAVFSKMLSVVVRDIWNGKSYEWMFYKSLREPEYDPAFFH